MLKKLKTGYLVLSIMLLIIAVLLDLAKLYPEQTKTYLQSEAFLWTIIIVTVLLSLGMIVGFFYEMKSMAKRQKDKASAANKVGLPPREFGMYSH